MPIKFENNRYHFSLFAPDAKEVIIYIFSDLTEKVFLKKNLQKNNDLWEIEFNEDLLNKYYSYKVVPSSNTKSIDDLPFIIDPYAECVCTYTTYQNPRRAKIFNSQYNWEIKSFNSVSQEKLVIYETHLRDLTIHNSSGGKNKGSYKGFIDKDSRGGLNYIKSLGVNAVEFLPIMEFGYLELPFQTEGNHITNTWNPYERNHWGYMTSNFFSPAAYYSLSSKSLPRNKWIGETGKQINEFKKVVDELHQNGIAVILDVVFNHLSEYEIGNLKQIAKDYYFRTDNKGFLLSESFCGNDLKSENHYVRKLIIDSLKFWITEYKIDGFRFDLGNIIDDETLKLIVNETKAIKKDIYLIAEPWGGGYAPTKFSDIGFASWNDKFRNSIKGENPFFGLGWIFGKFYGSNCCESIKTYIAGSTLNLAQGLFNEHYHSVNYLESHDGYTLGDFIRLGIKKHKKDEKISDLENHSILSTEELRLNKLAALFLFVSKGIVIIHSGQEFARSKVIYNDPKISDPNAGLIDHNSYEKDNPTNWINFEQADNNKDLVDYYKGLIELRKTFEIITSTHIEDYTFYNLVYTKKAFAFELELNDERMFIGLNADQTLTAHFEIPQGKWNLLVNSDLAGTNPIEIIEKNYSAPPVSGFVLHQKLSE